MVAAYLKDMFGTRYNVTRGVPDATMYSMAGLLVVGLLCNLYVRAVHERHHMQSETTRAAA